MIYNGQGSNIACPQKPLARGIPNASSSPSRWLHRYGLCLGKLPWIAQSSERAGRAPTLRQVQRGHQWGGEEMVGEPCPLLVAESNWFFRVSRR